ncbi:MAG TPA: CoA transferase [Microbacteriaceae bacterium]|nr:CoA transferase [Microbacteriaceae bacterium]
MTVGALAGVRVADFSRVLAGPHATMLLADLGADVIKIESPDGDGTRQWSPPVNAAGQSTYFAGTNRGKRSIVCDLRTEEGIALAKKLAHSADVVIQNFKPGTMEKFGLGYEEVAKENQGVVYCSISGFGEEGGAALPGYDLLVQAVGGLMSVTGQPDDEGGQPTKVGVALVDIITGLNAVIGIQAALRARDEVSSPVRGKGQHVRVNLLSSLLSALANQTSSTLETGDSPGRLGNAHPSISPYETFATADQVIAVAVGTNGQFSALCEEIGLPELASDKRFINNESRVGNRAALREILNERLKTDSAQGWITRFTERKIPAGRVNTIAQALELATDLGLSPVAETSTAENTVVKTVANPIDLSMTPAHYDLAPPELGEHAGAEWLPR